MKCKKYETMKTDENLACKMHSNTRKNVCCKLLIKKGCAVAPVLLSYHVQGRQNKKKKDQEELLIVIGMLRSLLYE